MQCNVCPRRCNAERTELVGNGYCSMPLYPVVAHYSLHFGEEPSISGERGSGTIFFSSCNLNCVFCQNETISHKRIGAIITPERLAEIFKELEDMGAHNINLVNPTHFIWAIKKALNIYHPRIPLVYNSSGYDDYKIIKENIFDIYLMDLKYISSERSYKYSNAADYFENAQKAIKSAYLLTGEPIFDKYGVMQRGLIVRHLVLPMATNEAIKIIDWFCENTSRAVLSLMSQYVPLARANEFKEINRKITKREYEKVLDYLIDKNLKNVYIQDRTSATTELIPEF